MRIFKYAIVLLAMMAVSVTFSSCSKDVDKRVADDLEGKEFFWMEFSLSNPGSLDAEGKVDFIQTFNFQVYGVENKVDELMCNPMYCTQDYATNNWNRFCALSLAENEFVTKVMVPVANRTGATDFEVTVTFSKNEKKDVLGTKVFKVSEALAAVNQ